jgi:microcystin-dependent protein
MNDTAYLGEIKMVAGDVAPQGWMLCNGQQLPIRGHEPLFALLGTAFGGDGRECFALPDLRGRMPIHRGKATHLGQTGGAESVLISEAELPIHYHEVSGALAVYPDYDTVRPHHVVMSQDSLHSRPIPLWTRPADSGIESTRAHQNMMHQRRIPVRPVVSAP